MVVRIAVHIVRTVTIPFTTVWNHLVEQSADLSLGQADLAFDGAVLVTNTGRSILLGTAPGSLIAPSTNTAVLVDLAGVVETDVHPTGAVAELMNGAVIIVGTGLTHIGPTGPGHLVTDLTG